MKINDKIHGFKVLRCVPIFEVQGTLYELLHEGSGAHLAYLERDDENKTFAIGFKTIPYDDTGVFHIIEHSVLCGSDKYPVKDPFVELLKGSQNTFLNAMTYEDRTVYPVSSRNPKDFANLVSVYMDAVLHPNALKNPQIFRQEGWHYEINEEGKLIYNGVVFNEMKGAYSSPDELSAAAMKATLFPDTFYRFESGGEPSAIPSLTYEMFCRSHKKYYHPSNSYIFLDGKMDIEETLALIDSFLCEYTPIEPAGDIPLQAPIDGGERRVYYEISEGEDPTGKCRLSLNYVFGTPKDTSLMLACGIVADVIAGSNDSPLKKAVLDSGLAKELNIFMNRTVQQSISIEARDVKEEDIPKLEALILDTIKDIATKGLDKDNLLAALNATEFKLREKDYGRFPRGVAFALSLFGATNYGMSPESAFFYEDDIKTLRAATETNYFNDLLLNMTINNPHRSKHIMIPDKDYGKRLLNEERERLDKLQSSLTKEQLADIAKETEALKKWQAESDKPEDIAKLPSLKIDEIYVSDRDTPTEVEERGYTLITHPIDTSSIGYYTLLFDASDLETSELFALNMLSQMFTNVKTEKHSPLEIQNLIKMHLGSFSLMVSTYANKQGATPYLVLKSSSLDSKKESLRELIGEVLLTSDMGEKDTLLNLMMQWKMSFLDTFSQAGHAAALGRAKGALTSEGAIDEYVEGYEAYKLLCAEIDNFSLQNDAFIEKISALCKKVITREKLTIAHTGTPDKAFLDSLCDLFPSDGVKPIRKTVKPLPIKKEAIVIPSRVSYAVSGSFREDDVSSRFGSVYVARSILSYEYLWNKIRVLGGAYGAGFVATRRGMALCYSYRDPSPIASLGTYKSSGDFLRAFAYSEESDLTKFIIGAIGEYDTMMTPRLAGDLATNNYLTGWTKEMDAKVLSDMKSCTKEDLMAVADMLDEMYESPVVCVVGSRDHIEGSKESFANIIEI